jgi:chemotaxis protein CheD
MDEITHDKHHFLLSGRIFVHGDAYSVTTVLGSCVSVCLWDPISKTGGMNHYMLPLWNGEDLASPKYGSIAITEMIEKMIRLGSDKRDLRAKIFGGGEMLRVTNAALNVGERNVLLAYGVLEKENIPIVGADVGGKIGRKIIYDLRTGDAFVKRLSQIEDIIINNNGGERT